jgi:hypothetical protein
MDRFLRNVFQKGLIVAGNKGSFIHPQWLHSRQQQLEITNG